MSRAGPARSTSRRSAQPLLSSLQSSEKPPARGASNDGCGLGSFATSSIRDCPAMLKLGSQRLREAGRYAPDSRDCQTHDRYSRLRKPAHLRASIPPTPCTANRPRPEGFREYHRLQSWPYPSPPASRPLDDHMPVALQTTSVNFEQLMRPRWRSLPCEHPCRYTSRYPYTGCSFLEGFDLTLKTYSKKGRPFIMCGFWRVHCRVPAYF